MTRTSIAVAIIYQDGNYLMQLRDDVPHIMYPGVWGFFGGHLEPGEDPETGLKRELLEEINYQPEQVTLFRGDRALQEDAMSEVASESERVHAAKAFVLRLTATRVRTCGQALCSISAVRDTATHKAYPKGNRLEQYCRYLYHCPLTVPITELELREGWDFKLLTPAEIRQGYAYSAQAAADKPLGTIHREIMLDFMATQVTN